MQRKWRDNAGAEERGRRNKVVEEVGDEYDGGATTWQQRCPVEVRARQRRHSRGHSDGMGHRSVVIAEAATLRQRDGRGGNGAKMHQAAIVAAIALRQALGFS